MLTVAVRRLLGAYPAIYLACHRRHLRDDESGNVLTEHQASVLDHLDARRPTTLSRLAEHMGVGRSAMSLAVTKLVRRGYIRRARGADRRSVHLTLTRAGARVQEHNTVLDPELVQELFSFVPKSQLEPALQGLEQLARAASVVLRNRKRKKDR
jgi:DNA-binding MarR family transcriptional regulator